MYEAIRPTLPMWRDQVRRQFVSQHEFGPSVPLKKLDGNFCILNRTLRRPSKDYSFRRNDFQIDAVWLALLLPLLVEHFNFELTAGTKVNGHLGLTSFHSVKPLRHFGWISQGGENLRPIMFE